MSSVADDTISKKQQWKTYYRQYHIQCTVIVSGSPTISLRTYGVANSEISWNIFYQQFTFVHHFQAPKKLPFKSFQINVFDFKEHKSDIN